MAQEIAGLKQQLAATSGGSNQSAAQVAELNLQVSSLTSQLEAAKAEAAAKAFEMNEMLNSHVTRIQELETQLKGKQEELDNIEREAVEKIKAEVASTLNLNED